MSARRTLRFVTWNVRHCAGLDGRVDPARIAKVLAKLDADVVALQELDVGQPRSGRIDQPQFLASALGMDHVFCRTLQCRIGEYGHALLSRVPIVDRARFDLPATPGAEPRAALSLELDLGPRSLTVIGTHLGLRPIEREKQIAVIADALRSRDDRAVLLGDLNAGPGQPGYEGAPDHLIDPFRTHALRARATWPAPWPIRPLDHVLLDPRVRPRVSEIVGGAAARFASDHRPVLVDATLE